eukprot:CAMPEP_0204564012 /NCGR_PEP_ID=MMETSP0661-20131031/34641_1 /ASSEMBLY_ACC=CAM_ASM_000606 /TAXON_ID=109239 /ORGANISM="Alexandrium margalefi, Strain AMGDE01CS-322" /LENGTH=149 /DNA_ID=CAMNT_0051571617 /DNA_START=8 /DNA_END=457 /DNA_ORIENTATION=+
MHSLLNVLRHGQCASGDDSIVKDLDKAIDLNYLTHLVFRCYEQDTSTASPKCQVGVAHTADDAKQREKARYRVEVSMSPGVQVFHEGERVPWPKGGEIREESCRVAPLHIVADSVELSRLERFLTESIKEYGGGGNSSDEDEDKPSDQN